MTPAAGPRRIERGLLIGCALLLTHGLGCTESEPAAKDLPSKPRISAPASVRPPHPTAPVRGQPPPIEVPEAPSAPEPAGAFDRPHHLTVEIEADPDIGRTPLTVQFHALVEGGTGPYSYEWNFGDGGQGTQNPAAHTYEEPGAYLATLAVSDAAGRSARQDVAVQVDPTDDRDAVP